MDFFINRIEKNELGFFILKSPFIFVVLSIKKSENTFTNAKKRYIMYVKNPIFSTGR